MSHATEPALDRLDGLLDALRQRTLQERSRGVFYRGSRPFLHFHEGPEGLYAHLRERVEWERHGLGEPGDWARLLRRVDVALSRAPRA